MDYNCWALRLTIVQYLNTFSIQEDKFLRIQFIVEYIIIHCINPTHYCKIGALKLLNEYIIYYKNSIFLFKW